MADEKKYLEGNYDGEPVQQAVQMTADVVRAVNMPKEIRAVQEAVYEKETERLSYEEKATGEKFEELMRNYIEEDKYHQYLVDGAVLRCTAATTDDFTYAEGETVVLENKNDEVCYITLDVHENPMSVNHLIYATVKDTVQQINITPPKCNCRLAVNRNAERKRIADDMERNKNGVCRHLMELNDAWDNFEVDGTTYLKKVNAVINLFLSEDGKGIVEGPGNIIGEEDGITMTSVLFCKHGGVIMPVTSGEGNYITDDKLMNSISDGEKISKKALRAVMELEILNEASRDKGYLVIEDGKLIGIRPHLAGDGYITVGFGDCLQKGDIEFYKDAGRVNRISGFLSDKASEYDLMKNTVIPVDICFEKLIHDITPLYEKAKRDFEADGITLSQNQLDAISIIKYQCYTLGDSAYNAVKNNADRQELYEEVLKKHGIKGNFEFRTNVEMNIYYGNNSDESYEVEGGLSGVIVEPLNEYEE